MKYEGLFKGESVLVTGGTGFIGSHLSRRLVGEGATVSVISRGNAPVDLISDISDRINICKAEITDLDFLQDFVKKVRPKLVFHLAANVNVSPDFDLIKSLIDINLLGTINMLKASAEADSVKKFVFLGTSDVYGPSDSPSSESQAANPISSYGASKAAAEIFCRYLAGQHSIPLVILRPFIVYGGGQSPAMFIPNLILSALKGEDFSMTGGEQTRDFLYVEDLIDACVIAGHCSDANGEIINIASGKETSLTKVAEGIMSLLDNPVKLRLGVLPYRENERWHVMADINKARRLLGWEPETNLIIGLEKTIHWYLNNYEGYKD